MTFHKMRTRLVAFGLALVMGLVPTGSLPAAYAAEEPTGQQENVTQENAKQEAAQTQHRVVAKDLTKKVNDKTFSIGTSLEGIEFDPEKDEVSFYKVIGDDGSEYLSYRAGNYTASYLVTPKDQGECYVITRKIILTDTEGTAHVPDNGGEKQKTDTDPEEESESKKDTELNQDSESQKDLEEKPECSPQEPAKVKITISGGKGDTEESLSKLQKDIAEGKVMIVSAAGSVSGAEDSAVNLEKGDAIRYPESLGEHEASWFQMNGETAYCLENQAAAPFTVDGIFSVLESNVDLQKVLYYGFGGKGDLTGEALSGKSREEKYIYTQIAASYAYADEAGLLEEVKNTDVAAYIEFLSGQQAPPSNGLSLSVSNQGSGQNVSVDAVQDGDIQKTPEVRLDGDSRNYIEISVPEDVTCYNVAKDSSITNGAIKIYGGDSFYLSAKMHVTGQYDSGAMSGSLNEDWKVLVLSSREGKEDTGVFESRPAQPVRFTANWLGQAKISLLKKDRDTDSPLAGAVYGIYKDYKCKELLTEMPETGEDGKTASEYLDTGLEQVYVKETKAPEGYLLDSNVYPADVGNREDMEMTVYDVPETDGQEKKPTETHIKKVDAVTGELIEGAVLQVLDREGNLAEEWISTKEAHVIYGLPEGEYILHEKMAPYQDGYVSASDITFQVSEESAAEVEMKDGYSKIDISVQDQTTGKALPGVTLQIVDQEGNVLKEWVTDGKPNHVEKLPVNAELILKETAVPKGYVISKEAKFIVTDTEEVQSIEMKNVMVSEKTSKPENKSESGNASAPKTGDALHLPVALFVVSLISFIVLAVLLIRRKKRYGQEEE